MICLLHFPVVQRLERAVKMNNKLLVILIHHDDNRLPAYKLYAYLLMYIDSWQCNYPKI